MNFSINNGFLSACNVGTALESNEKTKLSPKGNLSADFSNLLIKEVAEPHITLDFKFRRFSYDLENKNFAVHVVSQHFKLV